MAIRAALGATRGRAFCLFTSHRMLQAVASAEGAQGRVLTAVSYRGGLVTYVSHGWSLAPSAVYEAQVVATAAVFTEGDADWSGVIALGNLPLFKS